MVQNPWFWEIPRVILRLDGIGVSGNHEWKKTIYLMLFIKSKTIIWQKQHFLVRTARVGPRKVRTIPTVHLLTWHCGKIRAFFCVPFFSTEVVFISPTVSLLWICNIERLHNFDSVIDALIHVFRILRAENEHS